MAAEGVPIYVINRAADGERMAGFAAAADALGVSFTRIEAIDGHDPAAPLFLYRELLRETFWGRDEIKPGALACLISHMTAWRRVLADGAAFALICEDDARLTTSPNALAAAAARYDDVDIVFANRRMTDRRGAASAKSDPALIPVAKLLRREENVTTAPGADAYLISRTGAARLLSLIDDVGAIAGVDWLMLAAGLSEEAGGDSEERMFLRTAFQGVAPLGVFVTRDAVADVAAGPSAIVHRKTIPIGPLRDGASTASLVIPPNLRADPVSAALAGGRFYEEPALAMMARWMPRDGVFVDIGAHIGVHTAFMLLHGGAGAAIPFEHNRVAIAAFEALMAAGGLSDRVNAASLGFGLAEETGKREAKGARNNPFVNRLKPGFDETVRVRPGDALLRDARVDMIKIDVNGEEREVLKGLKKTLKRKSPLVVIDMTRPRSEKALPLLDRLGYAEAERAEWTEAGTQRSLRLFRATVAKPAAIDSSARQ